MSTERAKQEARVRFAATVSVLIAFVLLVIKIIASEITDSLAVWSDAMESIVHIASLSFMWYAVRLAQEPPDKSHPYGHGKVESFSVALEGALIIVAGLAIIWSIVHRLWQGELQALQQLDLGLLLILSGAIINTILGLWLVRMGKNNDSIVIVADGQHILSDAWTSWGVVAGVVVVYLSGIEWIDVVIAATIALHLLITGFSLVGRAFNSLMDAADMQLIERIVEALNHYRDPQWVDIHALRAHKVGAQVHIDFHLVVPGEWTVNKIHEISHHLEGQILEFLQVEGTVIVHLDPQTADDVYQDVFSVKRAVREDHFDMRPHAAGDPNNN